MLAFFEHLWGSTVGFRCVATLPPSGSFRHYWYTTNEAAAKAVEGLQADGATAIYHGNAVFQSKERKQVAVESLNAFYFDFDFKTGGDIGAFKTQLSAFLRATGLPLPTLVHSGGGVHGYWFLDQAQSRSEWVPNAAALKSLMKFHGFLTDPTVTSDSARVLRPVGTTNHKYEPERKVRLLGGYAKHSTATIVAILAQAALCLPVVAADHSADLLGPAPVYAAALAINNDLVSGNTDMPPPGCKPIVKGCAQIASQAKSQGADVPEPLWYAAVGVLRHTREARKIIHLISSDHAGYEVEATDRKIEQHKLPPTTCKHFMDLNPSGCHACPHIGRMNSPIALGYRSLDLPAVTSVTNTEVVAAVHADPFGESAPTDIAVPPAPKGFKITDRGTEGEMFDEESGEYSWEVMTPVKFWVVDSFLESREGKADGEASTLSIRFRVIPPRNPAFLVDMPAATFGNANKLREFLSNFMQIFPRDNKSMAKIGNYIGADINKRQSESASSAMISRFGWHEDNSFVLGATQYLPNGEKVRVALAPGQTAASLAPRFGVVGTPDVWRAIVDRMNTPAHTAHQATLLYAMASPLLSLFGTECGALWHLYTNRGGQGKSTLTKIAAAAMGNAFGSNGLITTPDDSAYGRTKMTATTCNTTQFWDEITRDADGEAMSKLLYTFTAGQEGVKGKASGGLRTGEGGWRCGAISSGNRSIRDVIESVRTGQKATTHRVVEVPLTLIEDATLAELTDSLEFNYGHAGDALVRYIVTHRAFVQTRAAGVRAHCANRFQFKADERFWARTVESIMLCGEIMNELGWTKFDLSALTAYLDLLLEANRNDFVDRGASGADLVRRFVTEHVHKALVVSGHTSAITTIPHKDDFRGDRVIVRISELKGMMYLDADTLKSWLQKQHGMSLPEVLRDVNRGLEAPVAEASTERVRMNAGTNLPVVRTKAVQVSMLFGPLMDLFDIDIPTNARNEVEQ